jgi:energy-coupling factor transporter transmembrane protein EcfT
MSSKRILLGVNILALVLALVVIGLTCYVTFGSDTGIAYIDGIPVEVFYVMIAFAGFVAIVSGVGVLGVCLQSKFFVILFTFLDILLALVLLIVAIFVLLYSNGISTDPTIDNALGVVQDSVETEFMTRAIEFPDVWVVTQEGFACCGIDLNSTYRFEEFNMTDSEFLSVLQSGSDCADGRAAIATIHASFPDYSSEAEDAAAANDALDGYFCKPVVTEYIRLNTMYIGIVAGVLVLIQIVTAAAAIILLTKVSTQNGGFVVPKQESGGSLAFNQPKGRGGPETNALTAGNRLV